MEIQSVNKLMNKYLNQYFLIQWDLFLLNGNVNDLTMHVI